MAISRIECLEEMQASDRKDMHQLRSEVRIAVDGVRAAVKAGEKVEAVCHSVETKIKAFPKAGVQTGQIQNGLKAVQAAVGTFEKDLTSLSARVSTLETQSHQWDKRLNQTNPAAVKTTLKNPEASTRKTPSKLPPKSQQNEWDTARDTARNSVVRDTRYASTPTGVIEVIPGISDILAPQVKSLAVVSQPKKAVSDANKKDSEFHKQGKTDRVKVKIVGPSVCNAGKDGSDVTVQDDSGALSRANDLLHSITRLFQKEKRSHSKIQSKLHDLEKVLGKDTSSRKRNRTEAQSSKREGSRKKRKIKENTLFVDDDPEIEPLMQRWLEAKKNLLSPSLPQVSCTHVPSEVAQVQDCDISTQAFAVTQENTSTVPSVSEDGTRDQNTRLHQPSDGVKERVDVLPNRVPDSSVCMEKFSNVFVHGDGSLKPAESWKQDFESLSYDFSRRSTLLILTSSILDILAKRPCLPGIYFKIGSFIYNVFFPTDKHGIFDTVLRIIAGFLVSGKTQSFTALVCKGEKDFDKAVAFSSGVSTAEQIVASSKLLGTLCEMTGSFRLLRSITQKILRWTQLDSTLMVTILASLASVSKQLLSDAVIRCIACELLTDEHQSDSSSQQPIAEGLEDRKLLENLEVSVDGTVEGVVQRTLDLLYAAETSSLPGFELPDEMDCQRITSRCFLQYGPGSWQMHFIESVESLELISLHMGWGWTYNNLIVERLWRLVAPGAGQATVGGVAYILGNLGRLGLDGGEEMPGVDKLRHCLALILKERNQEQGSFSFSTRLVAARSLLELSIRDKEAPRFEDGDVDSKSLEVFCLDYVKTVQEWFQSLDSDKQSNVPLRLKKRIFGTSSLIWSPDTAAIENEKNDNT